MTAISQIFPNIHIPRRSIIGMTIEETPVRKVSFRETWGGRTVPLMHPGGEKVQIEISNEGDRVWTPSPDDFVPGSQIEFYSQTWMSATIAPGGFEAFLKRDPVPGTVCARDADDESIRVPAFVEEPDPDENPLFPAPLDKRRITIGFRAGYTTVLYRPIRHCIVGDFESSGSATGRSQGYRVVLREEQAG